MPIVRVKCAFNMFADVSKTCDNEVDCGGGVFFLEHFLVLSD